MTSLKTNIVLNFLNTITGIVFPVITFPYAARVLLPEGIGTVSFLQSIVTYIVLFTSLGIPLYAVREVAKYRDNIIKQNTVTVEITILSFLLCLGGYVVVWILGALISQIHSQLALFYVLSLAILFTSLGVNWFYQAIEDFKFITIRAIIFRILATLALFIFVKTNEDLLIYALITVGSTVGNNFINFIHLRKYINIKEIPWENLQIWRHLKPSLRIFVFNLITSIYLNLNTVMLGFMKGDTAVGYYTAGNKISHIVLSVVASLGLVLLPRCANLVENGRMDEFSIVTGKSYRLVLALSLPSTIGLILLSVPIVSIFGGSEFAEASSVLIWTAPIIIFVGLSNVFGMQILYPLGKEKLVIWSTLGGAVINLILNLIFIPNLSYTGAAISTFFAELTVLLIQIKWGYRYIPFKLFKNGYANYVLASFIMMLFVFPLTILIENIWISLLVSTVVGGSIYAGVLWIIKDTLFQEILQYISRLIKH